MTDFIFLPFILTHNKINCLAKPFLFLLFLSIHFIINGQTVRRPVAAVYAGLGSYSINHVDVFSFTNNQASLAQMKNASAGVYGERRFMLDELSPLSVGDSCANQLRKFWF
jgi:hypothetical protein